jgi:hypothetical protein
MLMRESEIKESNAKFGSYTRDSAQAAKPSTKMV